ncbi:ROK family transcriptional regulator [Agrobacterium rhizogenes]|uniref:ROK family transcriptional regulator n=1 Tax=Rhizobium rhizogenes TaxID=359 RepID=UPI0004DA79CF|nr:ROK family transcriptional regulator [Rhizobium rhizogenes]OCJ15461.1 sugar kinase [Agrobacterium sp. B133/95]KEA09091.1 ROK family transcriptional regulator [Rhizobium rhizogenes]MQB31006.1 ROK family transcriptional regulator [Rhizobium rhizogenes]NTF71691.1 ROK family transcriptional regulator [Rhizobium rhizogenes]NTF84683.1 ROK family transcriptional regulator [Rhizobium rhizogenes]
MKLKGDQSTSRAMNRRLILNLLRQEGPKSRAEIATITGLSPAAVTFVIADLIEEGHVTEGKAVAGFSGRRPIPVEINYTNGLAIGFKLMVGSVECVVTDLATSPLASMRLTLADHDPENVAKTLAAAVPLLVQYAARPNAQLAGIGISMPGVIDNDQATCVRSHRFNWNNVPLASILAQKVKVPVWLEDDTNAYAIAQQLFGVGRQHRNMAVLAIGVGISCALIIEGKLYRGANGAAGKFGHTLHEENGRLCECGKRGCLMAYHSQTSMLRTWRETTNRSNSDGLPEMLNAVEEGEAAVGDILREAGIGIGKALANLVNVTDPEVIVVGGEAVSFGEAFFEPLRSTLAAHTFRASPPLLPDWEDNSWARGAAALVTQKFFDFETSGGTTGSTETLGTTSAA